MEEAPPASPPGVDIRPARQPTGTVGLLVVGGAIVAMLYFGREVFVPVLLAVLLSFVLAPIVRILEKWRLGRLVSVMAVVILAFTGIYTLGSVMGRQIGQLAESLPQYQANMQAKVKMLRGFTMGSGTLERAAEVLRSLSRSLNEEAEAPASLNPDVPPTILNPQRPVPVEIRPPAPGVFEAFTRFLEPLIGPLTTTGIVVIFVIFILLQREDLRNRLIRLAGSQDLQRTTAAIDDAAHRLSRYFLMQVLMNGAFGLVTGVGLAIIGVPTPVLWGILGAIMRFIPYLGPVIAAAFPLTIAVAVDPGWSMVASTAVLFAVVEPMLGQVIEPLVYGHSTGLSPVAVVLSATLWTALWGPVGLLVATPLTVCLVVLGRHVERLEFLDVILGDRPPLTPAQTFYQRMLARDPEEAAAHAEDFLKTRSLVDYYDEVALKGLALAELDFRRGSLGPAKVAEIRQSVMTLVDHLAEHRRPGQNGHPSPQDPPLPALPPRWQKEGAILCVGGRSPLDEAAAAILAHLLGRHGLGTRLAAADAGALEPTAAGGALAIALAYFDSSGPAHARYATRRFKRALPGVRILGCFWSRSDAAATGEVGAEVSDLTATTIRAALDACLALARQNADPLGARA